MRGALLAFVVLVGCASASAQTDPSTVCQSDSDCVMSSGCCPDCCACPHAVTRTQAQRIARACTVATCAAPSCGDRHCPDCPRHPACVAGSCTAH